MRGYNSIRIGAHEWRLRSRLFNVVMALSVAAFLLLSCGQPGHRVRQGLNLDEKTKSDEWVLDEGKSPHHGAAADLVLHRNGILAVQRRLNILGFEAGPEDGIIGPRTTTAIRNYQRAHGLSVDGRATTSLFEAFNRTGSRAASRSSPPRFDTNDLSIATEGRSDLSIGLPTYSIGTTFIYSDGTVTQVSGVNGRRIKWRKRDGARYMTKRNFLLPYVYWETDTLRGRTSIQGPLVSDPEETLWPKEFDDRVFFAVKRTIIWRGDSERIMRRMEYWTCGNEARIPVRVIAGIFDTVKFVCRVTQTDGATEMLVWYYAPDVGHYVRFERTRGDGATRKKELVAVQPAAPRWPPLVRAQLEARVLDVLSRLADGDERQWTSTGVAARVTIKAGMRYTGATGEPCRTYVQSWKIHDKVRQYPGAACRTKSGGWRLPVDTGTPVMSLAISSDLS